MLDELHRVPEAAQACALGLSGLGIEVGQQDLGALFQQALRRCKPETARAAGLSVERY